MTEKEFHSQRKAFAIVDMKLQWCEEALSHHEWLVKGGIISEEEFNDTIRGYVDKTGIYFYIGDFETSTMVEIIARAWMNHIDVNPSKPVYCGLIKGEVGERWKPIKRIR